MEQNQLLYLPARFYGIVFINAEKSIVIWTSSCQATAELNNGVLFYLLQDNPGVPLMLTEKNKKAVINFLQKRYSSHPQIKGLINWFEHMKIGEYLYVCPDADTVEHREYCEFLKESLKYYNMRRGEEFVHKMMLDYAKKTKQAYEFLNELHYDIFIYAPAHEKKKKYLGEYEVKKRVCIFCGGSTEDGKTTFTKDAHAISEAIGNKKYIQREECDGCNEFFAENVEEDLCNYLWLTRLRFGIKNKSGRPTFQLKNQYARYIDTEETDGNWKEFEVAKEKIKETFKKNFKGPALIGADNVKELDFLDIQYIKGYIPLHVYKALVKYAIGMMDKSMRSHFKRTIAWLRERDIFRQLPKVTIFETPKIVLEPELYLFRRKENVSLLPYCYGELRIGDKIFVFILPFCDMDDRTYVKEHDFAYFTKECLAIYTVRRTYEDFSEISEKSLEIRLDFTNAINIDEFFTDGN